MKREDGGGSGGGGSGLRSTGETYERNDECEGRICLVRTGRDDDFGDCAHRCESFCGCPSFCDCAEVNGAAGRYCVQS